MFELNSARELAAACAKDTLGEERYKYLAQSIEAANLERKRIGSPTDDHERRMLGFHKDDIARWKKELNWAGIAPCVRAGRAHG